MIYFLLQQQLAANPRLSWIHNPTSSTPENARTHPAPSWPSLLGSILAPCPLLSHLGDGVCHSTLSRAVVRVGGLGKHVREPCSHCGQVPELFPASLTGDPGAVSRQPGNFARDPLVLLVSACYPPAHCPGSAQPLILLAILSFPASTVPRAYILISAISGFL